MGCDRNNQVSGRGYTQERPAETSEGLGDARPRLKPHEETWRGHCDGRRRGDPRPVTHSWPAPAGLGLCLEFPEPAVQGGGNSPEAVGSESWAARSGEQMPEQAQGVSPKLDRAAELRQNQGCVQSCLSDPVPVCTGSLLPRLGSLHPLSVGSTVSPSLPPYFRDISRNHPSAMPLLHRPLSQPRAPSALSPTSCLTPQAHLQSAPTVL